MIKYLYSIFLLSLLVGFSEQKVNVTVLYEALCPDSAVFIKNQLAGCYDAIKDCIDLELVPYGHANHTQVGGQWRFECQHKERECSLNTHHACGIKYAPSQGAQVKFVSCMMEKAYVYLNDEDVTIACTAEAGINFNLVKRCYTTTEGQELSVHHGERTITFAPVFVPTIIFNNKFDQVHQSQALANFHAIANQLCVAETYKQLCPYCNYCSYYYPCSTYG